MMMILIRIQQHSTEARITITKQEKSSRKIKSTQPKAADKHNYKVERTRTVLTFIFYGIILRVLEITGYFFLFYLLLLCYYY
jgi:hypothetical protein